MKLIRISFFILFIIASIGDLFSQELINSGHKAIEDLIEAIASNSDDEDIDYTTLMDDLNYFLDNPINLNQTNKEELEKLEILTDYQINNFLFYIQRYGKIATIYELALIDGFNRNLVEKILPFVTLKRSGSVSKAKFSDAFKYGKSQLFFRVQTVLEDQKGFLPITDSAYAENYNSRYIGSKEKVYTRYKFNYKNKVLWGITAEKDAGELFFTENMHDSIKPLVRDDMSNGFDYYSAHLQLNDIGPVKKLNIGDYQMQFGQGLTAWSGMGYGKSPYVLNIKKKGRGIRKYSSTNENLFMRGIGSTVNYKNLDFTVFFSRKKIDANITAVDTLSEEAITFSSLQITGLHGTPNEIADKDAIRESVYGGNLTYNQKLYKVGLSFLQYEFDVPLEKDFRPYNQFEFSSNKNFNVGLDYQLNYKNINFFGEAAMSQNQGLAFVNGVILSLHAQLSLAVLHRHYEKEYQSYYGNAFSEGSSASNEDGIYIGVEIYPLKKWKLSAYADNYKFPWLKYRVDAPASGFDYFIQADYKLNRFVEMYWRIKRESKPQNSSAETQSIPELNEVDAMKLRYHLKYRLSNVIEMRNRIELSRYRRSSLNDKGYLIYHDVIYKPEKIPFSFAFRYSIFDTDSYDARIYAFENDVLYGYSIPAFYMKGMRAYITLKYSVTDNLDFWIRYAITKYTNKDVIGSGLTEIEGNRKSEIKVQIRYKF